MGKKKSRSSKSKVDLTPDPSPSEQDESGEDKGARRYEWIGYLAKGDRPGRMRLYVKDDLSEYLEVRSRDILQRLKLPTGKSKIWTVRKPTKLVIHSERMVPQEYMEGDILPARDRTTAAAALGRSQLAISLPTFCNFWCHTWGGGYTCKVYNARTGKELHDSLDVYPCAYSLGFGDECDRMRQWTEDTTCSCRPVDCQ